MTTLLVCDDEVIERIGLAQILESNISDISIIGHAENGKQAIKLANKHKPDIILMDIKMPVIDGLEATERILEAIRTKIIIVSSYDTFSYAQRAVRLGVRDYILKPSKEQVIVSSVVKVINELKAERLKQDRFELVQGNMEKFLPIVEADIVSQLLFDHLHEVHIEESMKLLNMGTEYSCFVMTLYFMPGSLGVSREVQEEAFSILKEGFHGVAKGWLGPLSGQQIPMIVFVENQEVHYKVQATRVIRKLTKEMKKFNHLTLFFGVGGLCMNVIDIKHSYYQALRSSVHLHNPSGYCFFEDMTENIEGIAYRVNEVEQELMEVVKENKWEEVESTFLALISVYERKQRNIKEAQKNVEELFILIYRYYLELGFTITKPRLSMMILTYSQLIIEVKLLIQELKTEVERISKELETNAALQIKQYINGHYMEDISLEVMAGKVGLTPHYVSKVFKDAYQISYIDYLTKCRIAKAKELIKKNKMSLKEISLVVGYNDPNYFSRVFKKNCDLSPSQYKHQLAK